MNNNKDDFFVYKPKFSKKISKKINNKTNKDNPFEKLTELMLR